MTDSILKLDVTGFSADEIADLVNHVAQRRDTTPTYPQPEQGWVCFHCGVNFKTYFGARLHFGEEPAKGTRPVCVSLNWVRQKPAVPESEGWYRVMIPGDSESIDGYTIYDFPDYEEWAYWTPAAPEELEDFEGGYKGSWTTSSGEDDGIFAYAGPVPVPIPFEKSTVQMPIPGMPSGD